MVNEKTCEKLRKDLKKEIFEEIGNRIFNVFLSILVIVVIIGLAVPPTLIMANEELINFSYSNAMLGVSFIIVLTIYTVALVAILIKSFIVIWDDGKR